MQTQRIIVICALIAIAAAGECPCGAGCPAVGNYKGACCHGNKTCETTNWTPATCTPAYGTWCPWKPAGRCGFSCNGDCSKCVSYSNSPYCQSAQANCEADCKGTWCPAESVPEVTLNATCACKPDKPCQQLNDGSCGQRVDDTGKPVAVGGQCAAGTEDCRPATDDDEFASGKVRAEPQPQPLVTFNKTTGEWERCPCQVGWPVSCPPAGFGGACCHGNTTCETTNWSKETCTPDFGTWCEPPPPGYCPCGPSCPGAGHSGACCHGNTTCETTNWTPQTCTPAYGTWCSAKN